MSARTASSNSKAQLMVPGYRFSPLGKEMTTHSSILAWRIPQTKEPDGPQSMALPRVNRHNSSNLAHMHRRWVEGVKANDEPVPQRWEETR